MYIYVLSRMFSLYKGLILPNNQNTPDFFRHISTDVWLFWFLKTDVFLLLWNRRIWISVYSAIKRYENKKEGCRNWKLQIYSDPLLNSWVQIKPGRWGDHSPKSYCSSNSQSQGSRFPAAPGCCQRHGAAQSLLRNGFNKLQNCLCLMIRKKKGKQNSAVFRITE